MSLHPFPFHFRTAKGVGICCPLQVTLSIVNKSFFWGKFWPLTSNLDCPIIGPILSPPEVQIIGGQLYILQTHLKFVLCKISSARVSLETCFFVLQAWRVYQSKWTGGGRNVCMCACKALLRMLPTIATSVFIYTPWYRDDIYCNVALAACITAKVAWQAHLLTAYMRMTGFACTMKMVHTGTKISSIKKISVLGFLLMQLHLFSVVFKLVAHPWQVLEGFLNYSARTEWELCY